MRKILSLLLITSAFISCKSNTKQTIKDTSTKSLTTIVNSSTDLIKTFKPIIQGVWVKSDYINKITKTKSPVSANDEATGITTMIIDTSLIKGDSLSVMAGYGNHEGGEAIIKFEPGKAKSTIIFNGYDLGYRIENGNIVLLVLELIDKDKKPQLIKYIKSPIVGKPDELGSGMYQMINKALIAGDYILTDTMGKKSKINFSIDGKVSGLEDFKTYQIDVDFNNSPMENLDELLFNQFTNSGSSYTYKISLDTLSLYTTRANSDSTVAILDKLKYKLVRSK
jgi:hypothetical protein